MVMIGQHFLLWVAKDKSKRPKVVLEKNKKQRRK